MTATIAPSRRHGAGLPAAPRQPGSPPDQRPPLKVVPRGYVSPRTRRRRARFVAAAGALTAVAVLFGLAAVHVLLTEGQFRLAHVQRQADDAQAQYVRLRLEVAQLESPERIVAAAQERLGMVAPTALTYLTPSGPVVAMSPGAAHAPVVSRPATTTHSRTSATQDTTHGWATAKSALASHP